MKVQPSRFALTAGLMLIVLVGIFGPVDLISEVQLA